MPKTPVCAGVFLFHGLQRLMRVTELVAKLPTEVAPMLLPDTPTDAL